MILKLVNEKTRKQLNNCEFAKTMFDNKLKHLCTYYVSVIHHGIKSWNEIT